MNEPLPWKAQFPSLSAQECYRLWTKAHDEEGAVGMLIQWEELSSAELSIWANFARLVRDRTRGGA